MNYLAAVSIFFALIMAVPEMAKVVATENTRQETQAASVEYKKQQDAQALELCKAGKGSAIMVQGVWCAK